MFCKSCGVKLDDGATVCSSCGAPVSAERSVTPPVPPHIPTPPFPEKKVIPAEYTPVSPWGYFGLQLLFSIPVVGLVFLIIFSFNGSNLNRRNFARSYWCAALVGVILGILCVIFLALFGFTFFDLFQEIAYY